MVKKQKANGGLRIGCVNYVPYGFEAGFQNMRRFGYDSIDFQHLVNPKGDLSQMTARALAKRLKEIRQMAEDSGIVIGQVHGPWRYPPQDATEADRKEWFEMMKRGLASCVQLGSENMVIHPIMPFGVSETTAQQDEAWKINQDFYGRLIQEAEKVHVVISLENMPFPHLRLSRPPQILKFIREMNSPWFKFCLDTGHCFCLGDNPDEAVRLAGRKWLRTLHVHDNFGDIDRHLIPFTGLIDWKAFRQSLQDIGFEGILSLENHPFASKYPPAVREAAEWHLVKVAAYLAGREL